MKIKMYLHGSKESNAELAEELGLEGFAADNFIYALYEVAFDVDVNEETGGIEILAVNGKALEKSK